MWKSLGAAVSWLLAAINIPLTITGVSAFFGWDITAWGMGEWAMSLPIVSWIAAAPSYVHWIYVLYLAATIAYLATVAWLYFVPDSFVDHNRELALFRLVLAIMSSAALGVSVWTYFESGHLALKVVGVVVAVYFGIVLGLSGPVTLQRWLHNKQIDRLQKT